MTIQSKFPALKPTLNLDFTNTKVLDPRITFTRASTATYWDGVTQAKAEENLLKYSQEFDNAAWVKAGVTVTANAASAPDGTTTADTLIADNGSSDLFYAQQLVNASPAMLSIYAKAGTANHLGLALGNSGVSVGVDLSSGAVTLQYTGNTAVVTAISGGWYRVTVSVSSADRVRIFYSTTTITVANQAVTGDGTSGIYIWGAQLEQRSQVTAYTPTTSSPITKYQPVLQSAASGVPRFDHNPATGESMGLLIEEQRTNLLTKSTTLDWTTNNATRTLSSTIAPDGSLSATLLQATAGGWANRGVYIATTVTSGTRYTASIYAKAGTYGFFAFGGAAFNLNTGVVTLTPSGGSASITSVGNGWYRCVATKVASSTTEYSIAYFDDGSGAGAMTSTGFETLYVWGAQLEAGAFPTSYIPTTTAQVTRAADAASMTGTNFSSWYRQDEGTLIVSGFPVADTSLNRAPVSITDGSTVNRIHPYWSGNASSFNIANRFGAQSGISGTYGVIPNVLNIFGMAFKVNDAVGSASGVLTAVDSTVFIPPVNQMWIGSINGASPCGPVKRIAYYPKRLSNTELQALTTP